MKKSVTTLCLLISIYSFSQSGDEKAIRQQLDKQIENWNKGNIEGFMETYWRHDSLMFIGKSGITYGWTNTLNNYKKGYPDAAAMGKLSFTLHQFRRLSSEYYQVIGEWHLQRTAGDADGYFTLLLRKIKGKWLIVADHSS